MSEPTVQQLANFARVRIGTVTGYMPSPALVEAMFANDPALVENWRAQHAAFQREIDALCEWCGGAGSVDVEDTTASCLRCDGTGRSA